MSVVLNTPGLAPVGTGRILLAAVSICETAAAVLTPSQKVAFSALDVLTATIAGLPATARGQVFVEVATEADIVVLTVPKLVTVAWLTRDSRSGRPGTGENCPVGVALNRAVSAWASEMVTADPELDGGSLTAGFYGPEVLFADLVDDLTARLASTTDSETLAR